MPLIILPLLLLVAALAWADTPKRSLVYYSAEAKRQDPGFVADSTRGRAFVARDWGVSRRHASCAACHAESPQAPGRHAGGGEAIAPLSPAATPGRFRNPDRVEKRFRRDCKEVLGRVCTAAEKADFIRYAMDGQ